jgi:hypothetical protein
MIGEPRLRGLRLEAPSGIDRERGNQVGNGSSVRGNRGSNPAPASRVIFAVVHATCFSRLERVRGFRTPTMTTAQTVMAC